MRILLIHSDYLKYKTKSKTRIAEKIEDEKKKGEFEDSLVVFTAVEKEDEKDPEAVVENAVTEVEDIMNKVKAENVVLYPYAHLSSSLSSPDAAKTILKGMAEVAKNPRISLWSAKSAAVLRYLRKTKPAFSISKEASALIEDAVKEKYPDLWEIFEGEGL